MLHGRLLRYIDEVARSGSIRKAGARLNVASSAINRHIIALEEEIGAPIFERLPHGLRLTAAGGVLIHHIRETLRAHEQALARIDSMKGLVRGEVTIATMGGLAANLLADAIAEFRVAHPWVKLNVKVLSRPAIAAALVAGEADLGVGYNLEATPRLTVAAEFVHRIGAVVAPDHPLAGNAQLRFGECLSYPIVAAEAGLSLRDVLDLMIPAALEFRPVVETNSLELMKRLARDAPHVTFLNRADVDQELRAGLLAFVPIMGHAARQTVSLVHRARGSLDPAASGIARTIEARFKAAEEAASLPSTDPSKT